MHPVRLRSVVRVGNPALRGNRPGSQSAAFRPRRMGRPWRAASARRTMAGALPRRAPGSNVNVVFAGQPASRKKARQIPQLGLWGRSALGTTSRAGGVLLVLQLYSVRLFRQSILEFCRRHEGAAVRIVPLLPEAIPRHAFLDGSRAMALPTALGPGCSRIIPVPGQRSVATHVGANPRHGALLVGRAHPDNCCLKCD